MALKDIVRPTIERPPGITCEKYVRGEEGKRCVHYVANGSCASTSHQRSTHWLTRNSSPARLASVCGACCPSSPIGSPILASAASNNASHSPAASGIEASPSTTPKREPFSSAAKLCCGPMRSDRRRPCGAISQRLIHSCFGGSV